VTDADVGEYVALVNTNATDANGVTAAVVRAADGDAVVAAGVVGAAGTSKATSGFRSSSSPWQATLRSSLAT